MKSFKFLALFLLFAATAAHATLTTDSRPATNVAGSFLEGAAAGFGAGLTVDFLRNHVLPDLTKLDLYGRLGICRDQLSGMSKIVAALVGAKMVSQQAEQTQPSCNKVNLSAKLLGTIVGACSASVATKFILANTCCIPAVPAPAVVAAAPVVVS